MILKCFIIFYYLMKLTTAFDSCEMYKSCHECIRSPDKCVYCSQLNITGVRCKSISLIDTKVDDWCAKEFVENPQTVIKTAKDVNFTSEFGKVTQIKPQVYNISIRIGDTADFTFDYKGAKDYPVDIYFLFDASRTMVRIKSETVEKSEDIYNTMSSLTQNVTLGMGTFIDKNTPPFTIVLNSTNTYSFRNRLNLTNSYEKFKEVMQNIPYGGNHDDPEGGLDALAQVMACKEVIGWRSESRKIIVFLTDSSYHAAGDGKLGGITQPYDGKCYTVNDIYTKELEMDYPSVGMINKLAADEEIIIFFVYKGVHTYRTLSNAISGSKYAGFTKESIVRDLKKIYEDITENISLKVNIKSEFKKYFQITFDPNCIQNGELDSGCRTELGKEKKISGRIKLLDYFGEENVQIDVTIKGLKEKLKLNINVIKNCSCEKVTVAKSKHCSHFGSLTCGVCRCGNNRYGDECECTNAKNDPEQFKKCKPDGNTNEDEECNGRGSCICGSCKCVEGYEGKYCQCNKNLCKTGINGTMCDGHGKCLCGKCYCDKEWTGSDCSCSLNLDNCIDENTNICNNRGRCNCGICKCQPLARWDARQIQDKYCTPKECAKCHDQQCSELRECAMCYHNHQENCTGVCHVGINVKVNSTDSFKDEIENWMKCEDVRVDIACFTSYFYKYDNNNYTVHLLVTDEKNCAESYYMFGGISLAVLIFIGIVTILAWKLLTDARDRYEYEKFLKEQENGDNAVIVNPTYISPSTTISNPTFDLNECH